MDRHFIYAKNLDYFVLLGNIDFGYETVVTHATAAGLVHGWIPAILAEFSRLYLPPKDCMDVSHAQEEDVHL